MVKKRVYKQGPVLCDFNRISLSIPRVKLIKMAFKQTYLDFDEIIILKALLLQIELAENKLAHVRSLIDKARLKTQT